MQSTPSARRGSRHEGLANRPAVHHEWPRLRAGNGGFRRGDHHGGNTVTPERALELARQDVADTICQPYNKRACLAGDWDNGSLVQAALQKRMMQIEDEPDA